MNIVEINEDYRDFKLIEKISFESLWKINNPFIE